MLREISKSNADNKYYLSMPDCLKNSAHTVETVQRILEFIGLAVWFASFFILLSIVT